MFLPAKSNIELPNGQKYLFDTILILKTFNNPVASSNAFYHIVCQLADCFAQAVNHI